MSNIDIKLITQDQASNPSQLEKINVTKSGLSGYLKVYTGQQGAHYVSIIPSLNVSGYGDTEQIAFDSLKENLMTLFDDLFELTEVERHKELKNLGWESAMFFKRRMTNSFIDEKGVFQNFDFPDLVKTSILQAA